MKICILSNSHGGALKMALDAMTPEELGAEITIFAAAKHGMGRLAPVQDGAALGFDNAGLTDQIRMTSGGLEQIDLGQYDVFLLHGLYLIPPRLDVRHSAALARAAVRDMLAEADAPGLARQITAASTAPVLVSPEPLPADIGVENLRRPSNAPEQPMAYDAICALIEAEFAVPGVQFLWQPQATIGERLSTPVQFATGSVRVDGESSHKERDVRHMNAAYGRIVIEAAAARIATLGLPA